MAQQWIEKFVESGDVIEDILYLRSTERSPSDKKGKSADEKYLENLNRRIRDLTRLLNCNFTPRDYFVTLTYSRAGYAKLRADKRPRFLPPPMFIKPRKKRFIN